METYIIEEPPLTIYRVETSMILDLTSPGFFLGGDVPIYYWHAGGRPIIPAAAKVLLGAQSLDQAIRLIRASLTAAVSYLIKTAPGGQDASDPNIQS